MRAEECKPGTIVHILGRNDGYRLGMIAHGEPIIDNEAVVIYNMEEEERINIDLLEIVRFTGEKFNGKIIQVSNEEYLNFRVGDKYYHSGSKTGWLTIKNRREADLANRLVKPQYHLESAGGKHLVLA